MKGRKKIPNELKSLRGTDQPCRTDDKSSVIEFTRITEMRRRKTSEAKLMEQNAPTTTAVTALPKSGLKGTAKKVFAVVATELINKNLLDIVGVDLVVAYAREMALYHDSMRDLETEGYTIEVATKNGTATIINPKRKIAESALANAKSLATEFGFTPASRNRVQAMLSDNKPQDDFIEFEEL